MKKSDPKSTTADPYLRHTSDFPRRPGLSALDVAEKTPFAKSLSRCYETIYRGKREKLFYKKDSTYILQKGCAVGLDETGTAQHFKPGMKFLGLVEGQDLDRVCVRTRDSVILRIPGTSDDTDRGRSVYCHGPNDFSLEPREGSAEIGQVRFVQGEMVAVFFKKYNDDRPVDLVVVPDPRSVPA